MVYRPSIDEKLCFVLMPFGDPFDSYFEKIIKPAAHDSHLDALRADGIYGTGSIIKDVWRKIWASRLVIADVTGKNANVNYELGLCHALGVPTILITRDINDVPFDYRHLRCIIYNVEDADWSDKLRDDLRRSMDAVSQNSGVEEELIWPYDTSRLAQTGTKFRLSTEDPRDLVIQGIQLAAERLGKAFGPAGRRYSILASAGDAISYKQGSKILEGINVTNPLEGRGVQESGQIATEISNLVGDGTKVGVIMTAALLATANELLHRGVRATDLVKGITRGVDYALEQIQRWSKPVQGDQVREVATTAAMDREVGQLIAFAISQVGRDGVVTVEESSNPETSLEVVEGVELDQGYLSEHFITDPEHNEIVLNDPYILLHDRKISSMRDLLPLLEEAAKVGEALLIIAEDVEGEALATLVVNKLRGTLKVAAIRTPGYADRRQAILEDIATVTGTKVVSIDLGYLLESVKLADLGRAKYVTITKDRTTIVEGNGKQSEVEGRVSALRAQIEQVSSPYDREKLQERLARLVGGVAVIKVGGFSPLEVTDKKYRMVSAMNSARSAIETGYIPGGASALYSVARLMTELNCDKTEAEGVACVASALEAPLKKLVENAGHSVTQILDVISASPSRVLGFNVLNEGIEDLESAGVLDPTGVLVIAVRVASAHARSILETEDWDLDLTPH